MEKNLRRSKTTPRIVRVKIGPSWPEGGMRKWEVIVSRALSNTASRVLDCVRISRQVPIAIQEVADAKARMVKILIQPCGI